MSSKLTTTTDRKSHLQEFLVFFICPNYAYLRLLLIPAPGAMIETFQPSNNNICSSTT